MYKLLKCTCTYLILWQSAYHLRYELVGVVEDAILGESQGVVDACDGLVPRKLLSCQGEVVHYRPELIIGC